MLVNVRHGRRKITFRHSSTRLIANHIFIEIKIVIDEVFGASGMKLPSLSVLVLMLLSSSTILTAAIHIQTQKYLNMINRLDDCYKHVLDDLCGMMDIALKFRDDPNYNYDPSDMNRIVMRDGINGTQELINLFHELINATRNDPFLQIRGNTTDF